MDTDVTQAETDLSAYAAEQIRGWMGRRRVSGANMARQLGVSPAWVSYRLTGTQSIDLNDLARIAGVLEVHITDLLPGKSEGHLVATSGATRGTGQRELLNGRRSGPNGHGRTVSTHMAPPPSSTRRPVRLRPVTPR